MNNYTLYLLCILTSVIYRGIYQYTYLYASDFPFISVLTEILKAFVLYVILEIYYKYEYQEFNFKIIKLGFLTWCSSIIGSFYTDVSHDTTRDKLHLGLLLTFTYFLSIFINNRKFNVSDFTTILIASFTSIVFFFHETSEINNKKCILISLQSVLHSYVICETEYILKERKEENEYDTLRWRNLCNDLISIFMTNIPFMGLEPLTTISQYGYNAKTSMKLTIFVILIGSISGISLACTLKIFDGITQIFITGNAIMLYNLLYNPYILISNIDVFCLFLWVTTSIIYEIKRSKTKLPCKRLHERV